MSDHDWSRVAAIRAALDEGRPIDPTELYWLCDACLPAQSQQPPRLRDDPAALAVALGGGRQHADADGGVKGLTDAR